MMEAGGYLSTVELPRATDVVLESTTTVQRLLSFGFRTWVGGGDLNEAAL